jgi:hypothetical protein
MTKRIVMDRLALEALSSPVVGYSPRTSPPRSFKTQMVTHETVLTVPLLSIRLSRLRMLLNKLQ